MHIFLSIALISGALFILILGLASVLRDLLERGPHAAPLTEKDRMAWPRRYQGAAAPRCQGYAANGSTGWTVNRQNRT